MHNEATNEIRLDFKMKNKFDIVEEPHLNLS